MKRILCLILCFTLSVTTVAFLYSAPTQVSAESIDDLEAEKEKLDKEYQENKEQMEALAKDISKQQEYLESLDKQIAIVSQKAAVIQKQISSIDAEIGTLNDEINQLSREIDMTEQEITSTENEISVASEELAQRLRNAYLYGDETTLEIFMGSDDLASFMTRLEYMKRTTENDKLLIEDFKQQVVELNEAKAEIEADREDVKEKRTEQQKKRDESAEKQNELNKALDELETQYAESEKYKATLEAENANLKAYQDKLNKEMAEAEARIDAFYESYYATTLPAGNANPTPDGSGSSSSSSGKGDPYNSNATWAWPLGNESCYVSSKFGYRDPSIGTYNYHYGIDIAGGSGRLYGKPVYAVRSGKVIAAVTDTRRVGYGTYVIIDHGDGYSSLYAHMSDRYVSVGATVNKGDMIGRVGNTGKSTGPHLHLEIRYYGEKLDPLRFVSKP
ncbi:MAG: peptidoglycan DD-metalloendopeptidase family protein [Clostridia bacterium]|nr:peptidoglycan DD-metalloendopeptidase family protein [Clostridia bacterium]